MSDVRTSGWARRLGGAGLTLLLSTLFALAPALAQTDFFVIQNRWSPDDLLNVEADLPQASPVSPRAPEAQWLFEPSDEAPFFRMLNVGTGLYLQNAGGQLVVGPLGPGADPDWSLEAYPNIPDPRIQSRAGGYLHTHDGTLVVGDASPNWGDSYWRILPVSAALRSSGGIASAPGPVVIRPPRGSGYFIPVPVPLPFPVGVGPPVWPACPPGQHLSKGHCCPPFYSWSFKQQACILQAKPIACPPGQHLSQGHCCPALKFWSQAKQQCVFQVFQPIVCPKGQHLSQGHCCPALHYWNSAKKQCVLQLVKPILCPPGQSWDAKQNKCVLQVAKPILCPKGQHVSDGHCCPALQSWDAKQNKCVAAVKGPIIKDAVKAPITKDPVVKPPVLKEPTVKDPVVKAPILKSPGSNDAPVKDKVKAPVIKDAVKAPTLKEPAKAPTSAKEPSKTPAVKPLVKPPDKEVCPAGKSWNAAQKKCV